jgi:hypothetical protein
MAARQWSLPLTKFAQYYNIIHTCIIRINREEKMATKVQRAMSILAAIKNDTLEPELVVRIAAAFYDGDVPFAEATNEQKAACLLNALRKHVLHVVRANEGMAAKQAAQVAVDADIDETVNIGVTEVEAVEVA